MLGVIFLFVSSSRGFIDIHHLLGLVFLLQRIRQSKVLVRILLLLHHQCLVRSLNPSSYFIVPSKSRSGSGLLGLKPKTCSSAGVG